VFAHDATDEKLQHVFRDLRLNKLSSTSFVPTREQLDDLPTKTLAWFQKPL
jgi:hypothetical protein